SLKAYTPRSSKQTNSFRLRWTGVRLRWTSARLRWIGMFYLRLVRSRVLGLDLRRDYCSSLRTTRHAPRRTCLIPGFGVLMVTITTPHGAP
ncbi:MAG: hypothetical protein ACPGWR_02015, partial [Ardenticatenaceae bacterium]